MHSWINHGVTATLIIIGGIYVMTDMLYFRDSVETSLPSSEMRMVILDLQGILIQIFRMLYNIIFYCHYAILIQLHRDL